MKKKLKLTKEEKEIDRSLGTDQWVEASDALKNEVVRAARSSVEHRKREARVNIRMTQGDVDTIRQLAKEEGLGYQTLMSSVLHKYASGRLVEKKVLDKVVEEIVARVQNHPRKKAG